MSARTPQQIRIELLRSALESISIPAGVYQKAMERYRAVTAFLDEPVTQVGQWNPEMYVQGSIALGTTNKPPGRDDFDFDVTVELNLPEYLDPMTARNAVERRLREDANYARMLNTEKNRCLRLDYAKAEQFHIDLVIGRTATWINTTGTGIQVSDRQLREWVWSDPLGFIAWFEVRKNQARRANYQLQAGRQTLINASADTAPDQPGFNEKLPLQWVIQIMKRHRDLIFVGDAAKDAPISVILTTLAAKAYQGEVTIESALAGITFRLLQQFDDGQGWMVLNPVIPKENFADKWATKPLRRQAFFDWYKRFQSDVQRFLEATKIDAIAESLDSLVGERAKTRAFRAHSEVLNEMQRSGGLGVISKAATLAPTITLGSRVIPPHSNYGSP